MHLRIVLGGAFVLCALVLFSVGCRDRFECGIRLDGNVTRCTGNTQVCMCSERRCAEADPDACPESGYAYVFPEGDRNRCVPPDRLQAPVIAGNVSGDAALCPDQASIPPRCGLRVSGQVATCPGNQTCLCEVNLCATFERTDDCPTGWRRAVDGTCLDLTDIDPNVRVDNEGLCPGARAPDPRITCGRPNSLGVIENCPDDQTCICGTNRCAIADSAACPATRFRYAPDSVDAPAECVALPDSEGERVEAGACADFRPARIPCGTAAEGPDCPDANQRCVCATGFCAEAAAMGTCTETGLQYVGSAECLEPAEQATAIADGLCAPACGALGTDGRIVRCPFGTCICGAGTGQCAVADATCPTGSAFVANNACVTYTATTPAQPLAEGGLCPATPTDDACGRAGADGRLQTCGDNQVCVCQGGDGRCAQTEPTCPDRRAFVPTNRCAPADGGEVVSVDGLLCPGTPAPTAIPCGVLDESGRVRACQDGEQCVCRPAAGACARPESACPFGLAEAHSGACVSLSSTEYTRSVAADALCPPVAPTAVACSTAIATECAGSPCGCAPDGSGVCVQTQSACPSGFAETATLRCIRLDENREIVNTGSCPVSPGGP